MLSNTLSTVSQHNTMVPFLTRNIYFPDFSPVFLVCWCCCCSFDAWKNNNSSSTMVTGKNTPNFIWENVRKRNVCTFYLLPNIPFVSNSRLHTQYLYTISFRLLHIISMFRVCLICVQMHEIYKLQVLKRQCRQFKLILDNSYLLTTRWFLTQCATTHSLTYANF